MKINYIQGFEVMPKRNYILTRLGYSKQTTEIESANILQIDQWIDEAIQLNRPKGAYSRVKILKQGDDQILISYRSKENTSIEEEKYVILKSKKLYTFLSDYDEIVLMGATIGMKIVKSIKEEFIQNPSKAVVYDAAASQSADACLDVMVTLLNKIYGLKGSSLSSRRYSPGYGDLSLGAQRDIAKLLGLDKIGITVTDSFMLEPEKSVIAIVGIK